MAAAFGMFANPALIVAEEDLAWETAACKAGKAGRSSSLDARIGNVLVGDPFLNPEL